MIGYLYDIYYDIKAIIYIHNHTSFHMIDGYQLSLCEIIHIIPEGSALAELVKKMEAMQRIMQTKALVHLRSLIPSLPVPML